MKRELLLLLLVPLACANVRVVETRVRRVESLGDVDRVGDELGAEGWRIVSTDAVDEGRAYVLIFQREGKATP